MKSDGYQGITFAEPCPASDVLELVDSYQIEATDQLLEIFKVSAIAEGTWVQIEDLEFQVRENLTEDESAQCIFAVCGGNSHDPQSIGETARHWVYYGAEMPGFLGMSPKLATPR